MLGAARYGKSAPSRHLLCPIHKSNSQLSISAIGSAMRPKNSAGVAGLRNGTITKATSVVCQFKSNSLARNRDHRDANGIDWTLAGCFAGNGGGTAAFKACSSSIWAKGLQASIPSRHSIVAGVIVPAWNKCLMSSGPKGPTCLSFSAYHQAVMTFPLCNGSGCAHRYSFHFPQLTPSAWRQTRIQGRRKHRWPPGYPFRIRKSFRDRQPPRGKLALPWVTNSAARLLRSPLQPPVNRLHGSSGEQRRIVGDQGVSRVGRLPGNHHVRPFVARAYGL